MMDIQHGERSFGWGQGRRKLLRVLRWSRVKGIRNKLYIGGGGKMEEEGST